LPAKTSFAGTVEKTVKTGKNSGVRISGVVGYVMIIM